MLFFITHILPLFVTVVATAIACTYFWLWMRRGKQNILLRNKSTEIAGLYGQLKASTDGMLESQAEREAYTKERAQVDAMLKTAGAVCHELNQPLQVITFMADAICDSNEVSEIAKNADRLKVAVDMAGSVTFKLMQLKTFKLKEHGTKGVMLLDIDKASIAN